MSCDLKKPHEHRRVPVAMPIDTSSPCHHKAVHSEDFGQVAFAIEAGAGNSQPSHLAHDLPHVTDGLG